METAKKRRKILEDDSDQGADGASKSKKVDAPSEKEKLRRMFEKFVSNHFEIMKREVELPEDFDTGRIPREAIQQGLDKLNAWIQREEESIFGENQQRDVISLMMYAAAKTGVSVSDFSVDRRKSIESAAEASNQDRKAAIRRRIWDLKQQIERQRATAAELDDLIYRCSRLKGVHNDGSDVQQLLMDPPKLLVENMDAVSHLYRIVRDHKKKLKEAVKRGRERREDDFAAGVPAPGYQIEDIHQVLVSHIREVSSKQTK